VARPTAERVEAGDGDEDAAASPGRTRRRLARIGVAVVVLVGVGALYVGITFLQVRSASGKRQDAAAEAIVVLGAAQYDGRPSPVLRSRLDHAYDLWDRGLAPLIVTTGFKQEGDRFTEAFAGFRYLRERGVPEADLLVVTTGTDTWEELAATEVELERRSPGRRERHTVLLVSDRYHNLRVAHIADEVGLRGLVSPTEEAPALRPLVRETVAVSIGRIVGYRRLSAWSS
jgi:uncharacterized SAM-binding protein YcdF (DUF218 family)